MTHGESKMKTMKTFVGILLCLSFASLAHCTDGVAIGVDEEGITGEPVVKTSELEPEPLSGPCVDRADGAFCDDGNACTWDSCDAATGVCENAVIDCNDQDGDGTIDAPCIVFTCDESKGCEADNAEPCDDGDICTYDTCDENVLAGGDPCSYKPFCTDDNPCTDEVCDPKGGADMCTFPQSNCADGEKCTYDFCEEGVGCQNLAISTCDQACSQEADCNDGNICTIDTCVLQGQNGTCKHQYDLCDDGDACSIDKCDPNIGCVYLKIEYCGLDCTAETVDVDCGAGNQCIAPGCGENTSVCIEIFTDCDDGKPCTLDVCQPDQGGCSWNPIPGCGETCVSDQQCEAGNQSDSPCDKISCVNGGLMNEAKTEFTVPAAKGCQPVNGCDDNNDCTLDLCSEDSESCYHEPNPACY